MVCKSKMLRHGLIFLVLLSFVSLHSVYTIANERNVSHLKKYITKKYPKISVKDAETISVKVSTLSKKHNVDFDLLVGLIETESSFNPKAKYKGNVGLMQVSYSVWKNHFAIPSVDKLHNIEYNVNTGIKILKGYMKSSGGNVKKALVRYNGNANSKFVQKVFRHKSKFEKFKSSLA